MLLSGPKLKRIGQRREIALEYIVGRVSLEPSVTATRWRAVNTIV
jgi:putative Mg2+ transporter-C (MgtC) family protein